MPLLPGGRLTSCLPLPLPTVVAAAGGDAKNARRALNAAATAGFPFLLGWFGLD
jgi:hypothetical protein